MKSIFKILAICSVPYFSLCSCSRFLDENPTTSLSESTVYSTEEALEAQVAGCYNALHQDRLWKGMGEFFHTASGLIIWKDYRVSDEYRDGLKFAKYSTTNNGNNSIWAQLWVGINRCNRLLDNLPGSPVDPTYKIEIEAETRFLRAWFYFALVRIYGDVPLVQTSPQKIADVNVSRTAYYRIYQFIIEDISFAEENMRSKERQESLNFELSRVCNVAATALKASVYLTIGSLLSHPDDNFWDSSKDAVLVAEGKDARTPDFSQLGINAAEDAYTLAYDAAEKVIDSNVYSLCPDYRKLFAWTEHDDFFLAEGIFVLPSSDMSGSNYNSVYALPNYYLTSTTENRNWGRMRPSRFAVDRFIRFSDGSLYDGPNDDAQGLYYSTADPRFNASFTTNFSTSDKSAKTSTYPRTGAIETTYQVAAVPYFIKYYDPMYDSSNGNAGMYLIRLAEMYLIKAEAAANLSTSIGDKYWEEALANVNILRKRARGSHNAGSADAFAPLDWITGRFENKEKLVEAIFWERWIELNFEGHEWFDTHRFGAYWLSDVVAKPMDDFYLKNPYQQVYVNYMFNNAFEEQSGPYESDPVQLRKSLLNAYPESELRLNTSAPQQNDFYWQ